MIVEIHNQFDITIAIANIEIPFPIHESNSFLNNIVE